MVISIASGKGGSTMGNLPRASYAAMARNNVVTDCDVDAADHRQLLKPEINEIREYRGGQKTCIFTLIRMI